MVQCSLLGCQKILGESTLQIGPSQISLSPRVPVGGLVTAPLASRTSAPTAVWQNPNDHLTLTGPQTEASPSLQPSPKLELQKPESKPGWVDRPIAQFAQDTAEVSHQPSIDGFLARLLSTSSAGSGETDPEVAAKEAATGFPDLQEVSRRMLCHVRESLEAVEAETGVKALYAGFDPYCSLGRGLGLPRSDIDFLSIVIEDSSQKQAFFQSFQTALASRPLVDLQGMKAEHAVLGADELEVPQDPQSDEQKQRRHQLAMVSRSLYAAEGRGQILGEPEAIEQLIQRIPRSLDSDHQRILEAMPEKPKHRMRQKMIDAYPTLPGAEKKLIWRLIELDPETQDTSFLDLRVDNPELPNIQALEKRGLLLRLDPSTPEFQASLANWKQRLGGNPEWVEKLEGLAARPDRLVAPWRSSHTDDFVVNDLYFPELEAQRKRAVHGDPTAGGSGAERTEGSIGLPDSSGSRPRAVPSTTR